MVGIGISAIACGIIIFLLLLFEDYCGIMPFKYRIMERAEVYFIQGSGPLGLFWDNIVNSTVVGDVFGKPSYKNYKEAVEALAEITKI